MHRFGLIAEVDHTLARVKVRSGTILTDWLPFAAMRAGTTKTWSPPTVGEQCLIISLSGELTTALVIIGIYTAGNAPSQSPNEHVIEFADGARFVYNQASSTLTIIGVKNLVINCPNNTINGNLNVDGKIESTGDQIAGGISQMNHPHEGVTPGPAKTGKPTK
ncbi:phage baseplate assembly protein V [Pasteurella testudinis DSM 23072]|uniref:Phage baseplate assembly protein V n=2 Tax=Pasteurella testudinis TaxID=761 RepID=A0A1W1UNL8_9PAST|nr:phage baseplate assembly protein V [Pasteurella testudinis DSM 23072]SUB52217.1 Phage P2 baseplate assembly protein gpV [Pasteurella testudinis]